MYKHSERPQKKINHAVKIVINILSTLICLMMMIFLFIVMEGFNGLLLYLAIILIGFKVYIDGQLYVLVYLYTKNNKIPYRSLQDYNKALTLYMKNNSFVDFLENTNIKMYLHDFGNGMELRIADKSTNQMYCIVQNNDYKKEEILVTIWGIMQMYFNENITINDIIFWVGLFNHIKIQHYDVILPPKR